MKKIVFLILCMAMISAVTFADDEKGEQDSGDRMAKMQQNLGLSDGQVAEIRHIRDNGGSKEEIMAVLTEEQLALMKERRAQIKSKGRKGKRKAPDKDVQNNESADN
jgi:hypothetical protein